MYDVCVVYRSWCVTYLTTKCDITCSDVWCTIHGVVYKECRIFHWKAYLSILAPAMHVTLDLCMTATHQFCLTQSYTGIYYWAGYRIRAVATVWPAPIVILVVFGMLEHCAMLLFGRNKPSYCLHRGQGALIHSLMLIVLCDLERLRFQAFLDLAKNTTAAVRKYNNRYCWP